MATDRRYGLIGNAAIKVPCDAATTAAITLSGEQTIDGVACVDGDRVLVKDQASGVDNGVYTVDTGAWSRAVDMNGPYDVVTGTLVTVTAGTANADTSWRVSTTGTITIGTTSIAFEQATFSGSDSVAFTQSGTGALATTVQTKLREIVSVKDFGATGNGTTDDLANIQEAIDYVATLGGGEVHFPQGDYKITDTIDVIAGNVMLVGRGGDESHDVGTIGAQAATVIKWDGAAGGTMIKFSSPTGASAQKQHGGGVVGFYLDSNYNTDGAGIGIHLESWNSAEIKNVFGREFATAALKMDTLAAGSLGEALDTQQNRIIGLTGRQLQAGGRFIMLDGNATASANASMNYFENCDVVVQGMAATQGAYDLLDCDNNVFMRCRAYAAAADDVVMFHAAADAGTARDNLFINFSTNSDGAIKCNGTAEAANPSLNNRFIAPDTANGAANPVVGTGASVGWDKSGTFTPTIAFGGGTTGITYGTQLGTYTRLNNRVFFDIYIVLTSKGSSTGAVGLFGLPFSSANNGVFTAVSLRTGALGATAATEITGYIQPNTTGVTLNKFAAGVVSDLLDTDVDNVSNFVVSGSYQAA